jgi:integrase
MAVRYDKQHDVWRFRVQVATIDGSRVPVSGTRSTKDAAVRAEREEIRSAEAAKSRAAHEAQKAGAEMPTFDKWFNGRFWQEWVVGRKNKPSEVEAKKSIYKHHLGPAFGHRRLDAIGVGEVAAFRARLVAEGQLSDKRMNNILAVLSKALRYAVDVELLAKAPKVGLFKVEQADIVFWEFGEYAKLLEAAAAEGPMWYAAVCLTGEAGLRIGEVRGLTWDDVDLDGRSLTVKQQRRHDEEGTPKGRTRRVVPMTPLLRDALRALEVVRRGYVVRNLDGTPMTDFALDGRRRGRSGSSCRYELPICIASRGMSVISSTAANEVCCLLRRLRQGLREQPLPGCTIQPAVLLVSAGRDAPLPERRRAGMEEQHLRSQRRQSPVGRRDVGPADDAGPVEVRQVQGVDEGEELRDALGAECLDVPCEHRHDGVEVGDVLLDGQRSAVFVDGQRPVRVRLREVEQRPQLARRPHRDVLAHDRVDQRRLADAGDSLDEEDAAGAAVVRAAGRSARWHGCDHRRRDEVIAG